MHFHYRKKSSNLLCLSIYQQGAYLSPNMHSTIALPCHNWSSTVPSSQWPLTTSQLPSSYYHLKCLEVCFLFGIIQTHQDKRLPGYRNIIWAIHILNLHCKRLYIVKGLGNVVTTGKGTEQGRGHVNWNLEAHPWIRLPRIVRSFFLWLTSWFDLSSSSSNVATLSSATRSLSRTFSSKALWCSKRDLRAFRTSTSDDTPAGDDAWRLTTVILRDRSCLETRHSRCSKSNCPE